MAGLPMEPWQPSSAQISVLLGTTKAHLFKLLPQKGEPRIVRVEGETKELSHPQTGEIPNPGELRAQAHPAPYSQLTGERPTGSQRPYLYLCFTDCFSVDLHTWPA